MPFKISYRSSFAKDMKSFKKNKPAKQLIKEVVDTIIANPSCGEPMSNNLDGLIKYAFSEKPQMRLLYVYYECCPSEMKDNDECRFDDLEGENVEVDCKVCEGLIEFVFVKTREDCNNLYKKSRKYIKDFLRE